MYSYDMEQAKGHTGNNLVTVLMKAHGFSLQEASNHIGELYAEIMRTYLDAMTQPRSHSFGDAQIDAEVALYIEATKDWPIGDIVSLAHHCDNHVHERTE